MHFDSTRLFQIWVYTVSHAILLLRSTNNDEENGYNFDVEFWGVAYLELPSKLVGVRVQKLIDNFPEKLNTYIDKPGHNVFEIFSGNNLYYVVAAGCTVGKNKWINENRVLDPRLEYDEVVAIL